jgi:hypothetical protein
MYQEINAQERNLHVVFEYYKDSLCGLDLAIQGGFSPRQHSLFTPFRFAKDIHTGHPTSNVESLG